MLEFDKTLTSWMEECGSRLVLWGSYWFPLVVLGNSRDARVSGDYDNQKYPYYNYCWELMMVCFFVNQKVLGSRDHVQKGLFYKAFDLSIGTGMFNSPGELVF